MKNQNKRQYVSEMPETEGGDIDWKKADKIRLPNLKLSTETISLRMPASLLENIKIEANKRDVPYQSLIKMALMDWTQNLSRPPKTIKSKVLKESAAVAKKSGRKMPRTGVRCKQD